MLSSKGVLIANADDGSDEKVKREEIVAKIDAVVKSEVFFFEFGVDGVLSLRVRDLSYRAVLSVELVTT